nr:XdhC family protein [Anaerolineae bacterium]
MPDRELFEGIVAAVSSGKNVALATIIRDRGSVPRHTGTKMLVYPDGSFKGTIGGGELELRVVADALAVLESGKPSIVHYELSDPAKGDPGVCGGQVDIFLEPMMPDPTVLVIGCGHVGKAVAELAHWLGFYVIVTDDREDLCNPETIPDADKYVVAPPESIASAITLHNQTYIVSVTRGVPFDVAMLPDLLKSPAAYIGVMGSKRRWATTVKGLAEEKGVSKEQLKSIHAPIGLNVHAETPREIAVSILAEIIAVQRGE